MKLNSVTPSPAHLALRKALEQTMREHVGELPAAELLAVLLELQGMVVLSGYSTKLYVETLAGWRRFETQSRASAGRGTVLRTEVVWLSPACSEALQRSRGGLFAGHAA